MEVKNINPVWLDKTHPNFERWQRARELSIERGKFVYSVINQINQTENLFVLDLGSGEGGTTKVFSENNFVTSFDLSLVRLKRQSENFNCLLNVNGDALNLPFANKSFDLIIVQDVIEHLTNTQKFYSELKRVLKNKGIIFLSTPNKFSIFNILNDPHFGLPVVSLLKRKSIKKYFLKYFRKSDYMRLDIAQLFSLNDIQRIFQNDFNISLNSRFAVSELFKGNKGIVWSDFHLKIMGLCKTIKLDWLINKLSDDNFGIINKYFTPTYYLLLNRKL
ncbi:MAG: class I SAM-dependent methyltransferase [Ignavibacteriaceae bacterium]